MHKKETPNIFAVVVPVASVPVLLKFVPNVITKLVTPDVVKIKVIRCPTIPPVAFKVIAPVGVQVIIGLVMLTVIVPVVADVGPVAEVVTTVGGIVTCPVNTGLFDFA